MNFCLENWPIEIVTIEDPLYPKLLKKIKKPPARLYYRGRMDKNSFDKCLSIVGSRKHSQYGQSVVELIVPKLVSEKVTTVSGFMYGIDSLVHQKTIEYGGRTVAVLGNGLNVIYPERNSMLYRQILECGGLIVSEYEPNFKPTLWSFPQRNRIVAGVASLGVIVVEAGQNSGSLITAKIAVEEGRNVYCVPGPITSRVSVGCNQLIKSGQAKLLDSIDDILSSGLSANRQMNLFENLNREERAIIGLLENEPLSVDDISKRIHIKISDLLTTLTILEIQGLIKENGGEYFLNCNYR